MKIIKKVKEKGLFNSILYLLTILPYYFIRIFYNLFLNHLKIKENFIVFNSLPDFSDNAKALYKYILNNSSEKNYKYIWLIDSKKSEFNFKLPNTKFVKYNCKFHKKTTFKALFYISCSKIIFFTHNSPINSINVKKSQTVVNLWHGCGYKAIEPQNKPLYFDYALVPGNIFIETKSKFWKCEKEKILPIGYPRFDWMLNENKNAELFTNSIKKNNSKLIIWMPTFRKTKLNFFPEEKIYNDFKLPILSSINDLNKLNEICKANKVMLCIKKHPLQVKYDTSEFSNITFLDNKDLTNTNIELYSMLRYTDALITDYSSIAIDYLLLDKPIGFTLDDYEKYAATRGFVFKEPKKYMPGHHIYNFNDLVSYISDVCNDKDDFVNERKKISKLTHNKCDNYCEKIVEIFLENQS